MVQMWATRKDIGDPVLYGFSGKHGGLLGPYIESFPNKSKPKPMKA